MSLQTIVNNASGITFNRRKMVGIQYTRNEIPRVSETPTTNPWRITLEMPTNLKYQSNRALLESIDALDRRLPDTITFANNPRMNWIFRYQGAAGVSQLNNVFVSTFVGNQLTLQNIPVMNSTNVLFAANDLIQIGTNPFPFTVVNTVLRGTGSTVTVTTHRPNILTNPVAGLGITVGAACSFRMFCPNMPTYRLVPGGTTYIGSQLVNNAYIEWTSSFELYEFTGTA